MGQAFELLALGFPGLLEASGPRRVMPVGGLRDEQHGFFEIDALLYGNALWASVDILCVLPPRFINGSKEDLLRHHLGPLVDAMTVLADVMDATDDTEQPIEQIQQLSSSYHQSVNPCSAPLATQQWHHPRQS